MKKLAVGILAHVDAGKTTLSESMLYTSSTIRSYGRVDKGNTFFDTNEMERKRKITIFSKQAVMEVGDTRITLLDTPGHVDFSAEMERALTVMDYAILVISAPAGIQSHTKTLWGLLKRYEVPVFLFINKLDQAMKDPNYNKEVTMEALKKELDIACVDFSADHESEEWMENVASCDEEVLEHYLEELEVSDHDVKKMIKARKLFPCYFGSALKTDANKDNRDIEDFLQAIDHYTLPVKGGDAFGARVFKIGRDSQGNRLTYLKVTGGIMKSRMILKGVKNDPDAEEGGIPWEEKINQIRLYSGEKFTAIEEADAGTICAVTGLSYTAPGDGLGAEPGAMEPFLNPVLTYRVLPGQDDDPAILLKKLRLLEEEEPALSVVWNSQLKEIQVQVMGEVQTEIVTNLMKERFQTDIRFDEGRIVYKETIANAVIGRGHFEPLRHYAEVHLYMEPGPRGSGLQFSCDCSEDILARNWQRLVLTHLYEKRHVGVLTGAPITDMKITLINGRAHLKHTEGGDFRQATYRAVRQGLMKAESVLLEPWYRFRMELPTENVGRAMMDIENMFGKMDSPMIDGDHSILYGICPVATMRNYQKELNTYTRGEGQISFQIDGYYPCHNQDQIIRRSSYDPDLDFRNPTYSVFCAHGAGFVVPWDQVDDYVHMESEGAVITEPILMEEDYVSDYEPEAFMDEEEVNAILSKTSANNSVDKKNPFKKKKAAIHSHSASGTRTFSGKEKPASKMQEYLLVDGYNVIHSWKELEELSRVDFGAARDKLMDILSNYQGYKKNIVILVFDAYKVKGGSGSVLKYHNIYVVYTREAETADQYIEKTAHKIGRTDRVTVATSDGLEQVIIRGQGCLLLSARELKEEIAETEKQIREDAHEKSDKGRNYLFDNISEKDKAMLSEAVSDKKENK